MVPSWYKNLSAQLRNPVQTLDTPTFNASNQSNKEKENKEKEKASFGCFGVAGLFMYQCCCCISVVASDWQEQNVNVTDAQ